MPYICKFKQIKEQSIEAIIFHVENRFQLRCRPFKVQHHSVMSLGKT